LILGLASVSDSFTRDDNLERVLKQADLVKFAKPVEYEITADQKLILRWTALFL
jgi:cell fate (sporulation/competence/biofilm development) regulator YmcA (YheA/YmcA/DUF963 family)